MRSQLTFRVLFSDVLVRSICDREIFTRVCRGLKTFCAQRTNLHIFFFIHSNAVTKSFFEVEFSWSVGDVWPKVKVRFPRDLHLLVCVFFQSFRQDYRQKNVLQRISFHLLERYVNFYLYFLEEIVLNLVYFLIQLFSNARCGLFPSKIY